MTWLERFASIPMPWPQAALLGALACAVGLVLQRVLFRVVASLATVSGTHLDDLLIRRMRPAVNLLVLVGTAHLVLNLRGHSYPRVETFVGVVEWLLVAYVVIEAAETLVFDWWFEEKRQVHVPEVLRGVVVGGAYIAAALSIFGAQAGLNIAPILATGSVLTVVLGFALQDTLGNLFAGLALHAENAFKVGDWLLVEGVEGQVVNAGWRSAQLRTLSGDIVSIPNGVIAKARQLNFDRPDKPTGRSVEFLVTPEASPEQVEKACRAAIERVPLVIADHPRTKFWFVAMHPLYQRWILRCWVADFAVHDDMESDVRKALWHTLREEGIALPDRLAALAVGAEPEREDALAVPVKTTG